MSLEDLERNNKAFGTAIGALKVLKRALIELPESLAEPILSEIDLLRSELLLARAAINFEDLDDIEDLDAFPDYILDDVYLDEKKEGLSPTKAVMDLLSQNPHGLNANDIVTPLSSQIETKSKRPAKLLYSILAGLKRKGIIEQLPDKRYRITSVADTL